MYTYTDHNKLSTESENLSWKWETNWNLQNANLVQSPVLSVGFPMFMEQLRVMCTCTWITSRWLKLEVFCFLYQLLYIYSYTSPYSCSINKWKPTERKSATGNWTHGLQLDSDHWMCMIHCMCSSGGYNQIPNLGLGNHSQCLLTCTWYTCMQITASVYTHHAIHVYVYVYVHCRWSGLTRCLTRISLPAFTA